MRATIIWLSCCLFPGLVLTKDVNVLMSEVFEITISPLLFNWTYEENPQQFAYQPSLLNAPDLPSWISYVFSEHHHSGFLFGVPPEVADRSDNKVELEVVALNRKNYETRHERINIHISEKRNPAKYEVHMKINNLNVEDLFDIERMDQLKDIFRTHLWKDSQNDLYVTLLASAIKFGARKPVNPNEGEGVVLRLGSQAPFSVELTELQDEVRPLWKVCPMQENYKRTSVERLFRDSGFAMDWCLFRLIHDNNLLLHQSSGDNEKLLNSVENSFKDHWEGISKEEVPRRSYVNEFLCTILIPMFIMVVLALVLSLILCFHHEGISKRLEDASAIETNQYATIERATQSLRSLSNNRDITLSPDSTRFTRSHTSSPTSTMGHGVHCRPSPPPYVRPKFKADF